MALAWDTLWALPRLRTYEEAAAWEAKITPIRGDKHGTKPVGKRSQKYRHIRRLDGGVIGIFEGWYREPEFLGVADAVLAYYPDGTLQISPRWTSASTNEMITEITGMETWTERGVWLRHAQGVCKLNIGKGWDHATRRCRPADKPNLFKPAPAPHRGWVPAEPEGITTHVVNRRGAKEVRARYEPALAYVRALDKLRKDSPPTHQERVKALIDRVPAHLHNDVHKYEWTFRACVPPVSGYSHPFTRTHALEVVELLSSPAPEDHYKAYLWLEWGADEITKHIDKALMLAHRDEWLMEKHNEPGVQAIDRYAWAFKEKE